MLPFLDGITLLAFMALLILGWKDLGPKWTVLLVALLLVVNWALSHLPGGSYLLMSFTAALDIVLVFVVFKGDVRLSG